MNEAVETLMVILTKPSTGLSRRAFLGAVAAGVGLVSPPFTARARPSDGATGSAIAFDGDALILARGTLSRSDEGETWTALPTPAGSRIQALATHPARRGRIAAALLGTGLILSEDGGQNWETRSKGLPKAPVTALAMAAAKPDTLYVAVRGDGVWQSEDAGRSWDFAMDRPWIANAERDLTALTSVDLATGMGGIWIYAGTELGLTRVPDCFCRWQDVQPGDAMDALAAGKSPPSKAPLPEGEPIDALISSASMSSRLYAALPSGIWKSQDAGVVWWRRSNIRAVALAVHPANADSVVAVTGDGLVRSRDGGITWTAFTRA